MKKKTAPEESKSLKTFFFYGIVVLSLVLISFVIKAVTVIQQSRFDGNSQFSVAIVQDAKVREVAVFTPKTDSTTVLQLEQAVPRASMGKTLAIIPDAWITLPKDTELNQDVTQTFSTLLWQFTAAKTQITFFDIGRLLLFSQGIPEANKNQEVITASLSDQQKQEIIEQTLTDPVIVSEHTSIQIINASGVSGIGGRLEKSLENMGANVVSVTTAREQIADSSIAYFGDETYTLQKFSRLLGFSPKPLPDKTIADIVITIGKEDGKTTVF